MVFFRFIDEPGAPVNLRSISLSGNNITLSWQPPIVKGNSKITSYMVYVVDNITHKATNWSTFTRVFQFHPIVLNRLYFAHVRAKNAFGEGTRSNWLVINTKGEYDWAENMFRDCLHFGSSYRSIHYRRDACLEISCLRMASC